MIVALTGTPGTGKTSIAGKLKDKGYKVFSVMDIARSASAIMDYDEITQSYNIDITMCTEYLRTLETTEILIIEGHLSHMLAVDYAIVLRLNPRILYQRLLDRGYSIRKVAENVEAEAIDLITVEAVDLLGELNVFEVDTTGKDLDSLVNTIDEIIRFCYDHTHNRINNDKIEVFKIKNRFVPGTVNWSEVFMSMVDEVARYGIPK